MWCNCDAVVPLDLFTPRRAKCVLFCSPWASRSSFQLCGWGWLQYIRPRYTFDVSSPIMSRAFSAIHSHFNKSLDHISVYSSQFVFSIMQSTLTRLFNQKMHLLLWKPLQSFLCNYRALSDPSIVQKTKTTIFFYSLVFCGRCFHIYRIFPSNFSSLLCLSEV